MYTEPSEELRDRRLTELGRYFTPGEVARARALATQLGTFLLHQHVKRLRKLSARFSDRPRKPAALKIWLAGKARQLRRTRRIRSRRPGPSREGGQRQLVQRVEDPPGLPGLDTRQSAPSGQRTGVSVRPGGAAPQQGSTEWGTGRGGRGAGHGKNAGAQRPAYSLQARHDARCFLTCLPTSGRPRLQRHVKERARACPARSTGRAPLRT